MRKEMTKASAVATQAAPVAEKKEKKAAEPVEIFVTSKDLAHKLGVKPTNLRRYLRTLPAFQDKTYTRYKWKPDDPFLDDVVTSFKKFQETEAEKAEKRKATIREKQAKIDETGKVIEGKVAAASKPKAAKKAAPVPAPVAVAEADE